MPTLHCCRKLKRSTRTCSNSGETRLTKLVSAWVSSPGESLPEALVEPYVSLSTHTALTTAYEICAFSGFFGIRDVTILSTVPEMVVLDRVGILSFSRCSSAILADRAMRGFAISFLTLARALSPDSFLPFSRGIRAA
jgi:hypothetical protein